MNDIRNFRIAIMILVMLANMAGGDKTKQSVPEVQKLTVEIESDHWNRVSFSYRSDIGDGGQDAKPPQVVNDHSGLLAQGGQLVLASGGKLDMVLMSGFIHSNNKKVSLDVSGLGNCWNLDDHDPIPKNYTLIEDLGEGVTSLKVCFARGGAQDFMVEWWIKNGASIRMKIEYLGDDLPEWTKR